MTPCYHFWRLLTSSVRNDSSHQRPCPMPGSTIHTRSRTSPDISAVGTHGPLGSNGDGRRESRPPSLSNAHFRKKCRLRWVGGGQNSEAGDRRTTVARQRRQPGPVALQFGRERRDTYTTLRRCSVRQAHRRQGIRLRQGYGGRGCAVPTDGMKHGTQCRGYTGASLLRRGGYEGQGSAGLFFGLSSEFNGRVVCDRV